MRKKMTKTIEAMSAAAYLGKPYGRVVTPESDGSFHAEILEFPGCIAIGDEPAEALANLEEVAASWLEATIEKGQDVPEPQDASGFSGKLVLRLPKSLHRKAARQAARDNVSLNQFIVASVAEQVGAQVIHSSTSPRPSSTTEFSVLRANLLAGIAINTDTSLLEIGWHIIQTKSVSPDIEPSPIYQHSNWLHEDQNA